MTDVLRTPLGDTVAWRAPEATRLKRAPANDWSQASGNGWAPRTRVLAPEVQPRSSVEYVVMDAKPASEVPARWLIAIGGGVAAALLGLMLGGALAL